MTATPASNLTDPGEIRRGLGLLFEPGQVIELRAWGCHQWGEGLMSGFFDNLDLAAEAAAGLSKGGENYNGKKLAPATGVFVTLNPMKSSLLAMSANRLKQAKTGEATPDKHVTRRRWLLIDCDPDRDGGVAKISATDEEKAEARKLAKLIARTLRDEFGWPDPLFCDSGNGYHSLYRIDLPNDEESHHRVEAILKALAARFDTEAVKVDTSVFNASRVCKVPGTGVRKADALADRPHRMSQIVHAPDSFELVSLAQIDQVIAAWLPADAPAETMGRKGGSYSGPGKLDPFDMEGFISKHGIEARSPKPYQGSGTKWQVVCPFDSSHKMADACLFVSGDGAPGFRCLHNSCRGKDFRAVAERLGDSETLARFEKGKKPNNGNFGNNAPKEYISRERERVYSKREIDNIDKIDRDAPWEAEPESLDAENLAGFPLHSLPPRLQAFCMALADSVGVDASLPGVLLLGALSAAVQKRAAVRIKRDYTEQLSIWSVAVAAPGERKSPVVSRIRAPFARYEARINTEREPLIEEYESDERVLREVYRKAESQVSKDGSEGSREKLRQARAELRDLVPVRPLRLLVDDVTSEALPILQSEQEGRLAIIDAESGAFDNLSGRYSSAPNLGPFLKSWTGEALSMERATINDKTGQRKSISVAKPALAMAVATQPGALDALRGNKRLSDLGVLQRCLFAFVPGSEGVPSMRAPSVPPELEREYSTLIESLLALEATTDTDDEGERIPHYLDLSPEALRLAEEMETRFLSWKYEETGPFQEWLSKAHGQCYRLAGVLHLAEHGRAGVELKISGETLAAARETMEYFAIHSREALGRIRDGEGVADARHVMKWVRRNLDRLDATGCIKARDLWRQVRAVATEEERDRAIGALVTLGCARLIEPPEREGAGRPVGLILQFHPSLTWGVEV